MLGILVFKRGSIKWQNGEYLPFKAFIPRHLLSPTFKMVKAAKGVLIQCDESIMAIIIDIDSKNKNIYILETLDSETCLVQGSKLHDLKVKLNEVCIHLLFTDTD